MAVLLPSSLRDVLVLPPRGAGPPCVAIGPGGVWVVGSAWVDAPDRVTRRRLHREAAALRLRLRGTRWASVPVTPLVCLDEDTEEHLLRDGTLAAGPVGTLAVVRRGSALDALDVAGIAAALRP